MEQTKKLNMTAMSDKTNSNTTAKKEEPAWEHKVAMKVSGVSIAVNLLLSLFKLLAGSQMRFIQHLMWEVLS